MWEQVQSWNFPVLFRSERIFKPGWRVLRGAEMIQVWNTKITIKRIRSHRLTNSYFLNISALSNSQTQIINMKLLVSLKKIIKLTINSNHQPGSPHLMECLVFWVTTMLPIRPGKFALDLCSYQCLGRSPRHQPWSHALAFPLAFLYKNKPPVWHRTMCTESPVLALF